MFSHYFAEVAVFRPINSMFEYTVPEHLSGSVSVGSLCNIPFRGKIVRGVVLELSKEPKYGGEKKAIEGLISDEPLPSAIIELAKWLSRRTLTPPGQVLNRFVPSDLSVRPRREDKIELSASFQKVSDFIE